jgi:hypothetical protein
MRYMPLPSRHAAELQRALAAATLAFRFGIAPHSANDSRKATPRRTQ